jgi:DNA invertase Pin-like site-specific DNA recombinase
VRNHFYVENTFRPRRKVGEPRLIVWEFKGKNINVHFIKAGSNLRSGNYKLKFMLTILGTLAEEV